MKKILLTIMAVLLCACHETPSIKDNTHFSSFGGETSSHSNKSHQDQEQVIDQAQGGSESPEQPQDDQEKIVECEESCDLQQDENDTNNSDAIMSDQNLTQQPENVETDQLPSLVGLTNFFQVSDELYRSAQPTNGGLTSIQSLGIKTVLSFQLVNIDTTLESTENTGLTIEHVPMVPWNITFENMVDALKIIKNAEKPILVHCLHGSDRTGLVVAMYRIVFQGWTKDAAKDELINGGFGYHDSLENIPVFIDEVDVDALKNSVFE